MAPAEPDPRTRIAHQPGVSPCIISSETEEVGSCVDWNTQTSTASLLPVPGRSIALLVGIMFTQELAVFGAPEIPFALEMIYVGAGVDPNQLIPGAGHAGCRSVNYGLGESRVSDT
jgi:hypothetical protein